MSEFEIHVHEPGDPPARKRRRTRSKDGAGKFATLGLIGLELACLVTFLAWKGFIHIPGVFEPKPEPVAVANHAASASPAPKPVRPKTGRPAVFPPVLLARGGTDAASRVVPEPEGSPKADQRTDDPDPAQKDEDDDDRHARAAKPRKPVATAPSVLTDHQLKRSGTKFVLETEGPVIAQRGSLQGSLHDLEQALAASLMIGDNDLAITNLKDARAALQAEINQYGIVMNANPPRNNQQRDVYDAARSQQMADQLQLTQIDLELTMRNNRVPPAQERKQIGDKLEAGRKACREALTALRTTAAPVQSRYEELAHDKDITNALAALSRQEGVPIELGPSDDFRATLLLIDQADNLLNGPPPQPPATAKPKGTKKTKHH